MPYSDSTLMSMRKSELINVIRCLEHNWKEESKRNKIQFLMLCEKDKYRWHDLRKNPDDLPGNGTKCIVAVKWGNISDYFSCKYNDGKFQIVNFENIVAWRVNEPFEEEQR